MADTQTTTSDSSTQQVWLKQLSIPELEAGKGPVFLTAFQTALQSLQSSGLTKFTLSPPLKMRFDSQSFEAATYKVSLEKRTDFGLTPTQKKAAQLEFWYLDDLAIALVQVASWLRRYYNTQSASLAQSNELAELEDLVAELRSGQLVDYVQLRERRKTFETTIDELLAIIDSLAPKKVVAEVATDSLGNLLHLLENPAEALSLWRSDVLSLAKSLAAVKAAEAKTITVAGALASDPSPAHGGVYQISQVRLVLHTFIETIREIFKDDDGVSKYLAKYLPKNERDRKISEILDDKDFQELLNNSANFYFAAEQGVLEVVLTDADLLRADDTAKAAAFVTFFTKKEVMGRIFGQETFAAPSAAAAEAAEGPEAPTTEDIDKVAEAKGQVFSLNDAQQKIYDELYKTLFAALRLSTITDPEILGFTTDQLRSDIERLNFIEALKTGTIDNFVDAEGKSAPAPLFDPTTQSIRADFFVGWVVVFLPKAVAQFELAQGSLTDYRLKLLRDAETTIAVLDDDLEVQPAAVAVTTDGLKTTIANQKIVDPDSAITKLLPSDPDAITADWWNSLSGPQRRSLASLTLGNSIGNAAEKTRLINALSLSIFNDSAIGWKDFSPDSLTPEMRTLFLASIETSLGTLSYDDFLRGLNNPTYARLLLIKKAQQALRQNPAFSVFVQKFLDEKALANRTEALKAAGKDELSATQTLRFDNAVEAMVVTFQDYSQAEKFISKLSGADLERHFDVSVSSEQQARFKAELLRLLQARYQGERYYLTNKLAAEGHQLATDKLGLHAFDEDEYAQLQDALDQYRLLLAHRNLGSVLAAYHSPYDPNPPQGPGADVDEWKFRKAVVEVLWQELWSEGLVEQAKADPNFVPSVLIQEMNSQKTRTTNPRTLRKRLSNNFSRLTGRGKALTGSSLSKGVASSAAIKAATMVDPTGTSLVANRLLNAVGVSDEKQAQIITAVIPGVGMFLAANPLALMGAAIGGAIGTFVGSVIGMPFLGAAGAGLGAGVGFAVQQKYLSASDAVKSAGSAPSKLLDSAAATSEKIGAINPELFKPSILSGGGAPVIIGTAGAATAAFMSIMSIQSAMIDPLSITPQATEFSKYVNVTKDVSPSKLENGQTADVTYTITIDPQEDYVILPTVEQITDDFSYLGGDALSLPSQTEAVRSQLPAGPIADTTTITYTVAGVVGEDVQVNNTFHFVFSVQGEAETSQTLDVVGSLIIGDPDVGCFVFGEAGFNFGEGSGYSGVISKEWTEKDKGQILAAFSRRAGSNATYLSYLCNDINGDGESDPVYIYRLPGGVTEQYGGWAPSGYEKRKMIGMYDYGMMFSVDSTEYTLVHELGHILDYHNPTLHDSFRRIWSKQCFTYPKPSACVGGEGSEAMAESIVLYVISGTYRFSINDAPAVLFPFQSRGPAEYEWAKNTLFGGQEFQ